MKIFKMPNLLKFQARKQGHAHVLIFFVSVFSLSLTSKRDTYRVIQVLFFILKNRKYFFFSLLYRISQLRISGFFRFQI